MAKTQTRKPAKRADKVSINEADTPARKGQRQPRRRATGPGSVAAAKLADTVAGTAAASSQAADAALPITSNQAPEQSALPSEPELRGASATAATVPGSELPRASTKRAILVGMLERAQGASVTEMGQHLGWLPHTVRAAITGLRHAGRDVTRSKDEKGQTVYRLTPIETPDR
jgi:Protein of unknown function (DUF3489)